MAGLATASIHADAGPEDRRERAAGRDVAQPVATGRTLVGALIGSKQMSSP
jgi:hypothetical protein